MKCKLLRVYNTRIAMYYHQNNRILSQKILAYKIKNFFDRDVHFYKEMNKVIRIEVKIDNFIEPLQWLLQQKSSVKTYWSDREKTFEMAGIGVADAIIGDKTINYSSLFARLKSRLSASYKHLRYYGGISFRQKPIIDDCWQQFGSYRFVIPRFEVYVDKNLTYLACNFILEKSSDYKLQLNQILFELDELVFSTQFKAISLPEIHNRIDLPDKNAWNQNIQVALTSFTKGETAKIVLARKSTFEFSESVEPLILLLLLKNLNPRVFHFCFQTSFGNAFIGGTPELLYSRANRLIQTEAIAGTRRRGNSLEEDQELSQELLHCDKDIREHQFVVHSLRGILSQLCYSMGEVRETAILKLNKVQHLYAPCYGILLDKFSDAEILPMLHPTPAVGGYPKEQAQAIINEIEPFERGWYAGPVGWVGYNATGFAVAIRSGLVQNNQLSLFSGAGIVEGSKPEDEWQEIEHKISSFLQIFGNGLQSVTNGKSEELLEELLTVTVRGGDF